MTETAQRTAAEIRAELDAIAPLPGGGEVTALQLARHFAVRAQERWSRLLARPSLGDALPWQVCAMAGEFAAAHALYGLVAVNHQGAELPLGVPPAVAEGIRGCSPDDVAGQIRDAVEGGSDIGEWLFDHLGEETVTKVRELVPELVAAIGAEAVKSGD